MPKTVAQWRKLIARTARSAACDGGRKRPVSSTCEHPSATFQCRPSA